MILRICFTFFTIYLLFVKYLQLKRESPFYATDPRVVFNNEHLLNACVYFVCVCCILRSLPFFVISVARIAITSLIVEYYEGQWSNSDKWFKFGMCVDIIYYAMSIFALMIL